MIFLILAAIIIRQSRVVFYRDLVSSFSISSCLYISVLYVVRMCVEEHRRGVANTLRASECICWVAL